MKTNRTLKLITLTAAIFGFAATSFAQVGVGATASASANIVTPIAITKTVDMDFGNIAVNNNAGTVQLAPSESATRTPSGGVTLPTAVGNVKAAKFSVTGAANYGFSITLPTSTVVVKNGSNTMNIDTFTSSLGALSTLSGSGAADFYVGATLYVTGGQAEGAYTTETPFTVTVNYN